ncbi:lipase family protein [Gloeothece verrucosa]|uniref:Lipase class 3 n=1 Tax=Gloeothece verrucosa (strain PCC 7822) TaxID=497965 RepID=E0UC32_GLOV7|nr:lipase family protein [Gloeothece verrucosa]ADN16370.1 lipase class 3 [Gloeothece verrucosa PCC 7822]
MLSVPPNSTFDIKRARELLLLVEQAHHEFDNAESNHQWAWHNDYQDIQISQANSTSKYKVIQRFGFDQYFWSLQRILLEDIDKLMEAIQEEVPFGFVAQKNNEIFVVFRGTMTPAEWITNFQFKPGSKYFLEQEGLGKVHRGFYKIYTRHNIGRDPFSNKGDFPSIREDIENALRKCSPDTQVYVTGHSLGGALATLATLHIKEMKFFNNPPILYAFANPRAGGRIFAQNFNGLECFRIANSEDIVPTVPLASVDLKSENTDNTTAKSLEQAKPTLIPALLPDLDYHHIGEPIYFTLNKGTIADNHIIPIYQEALARYNI